jgi:CBS domain-containing protein
VANGPWTKFQAPESSSTTPAQSPGAAAPGPWTKFVRSTQESSTQETPPKAPFLERATRALDYVPPVATAETGLSLASGMVATPIAGLAGLAQGATNAMGVTNTPAADVVRGVQEKLTYQPRTKLGQATTRVISYPFEKLAQGADIAGAKTAEVTGSPALGAAVNTALQAAPAAIGKGAGRIRAARTAPREAAAAEAGAKPSTAQTPEARARDYVARNTALDWDRLSDRVKKTLTGIAEDSRNLTKLNPQAIERQARLESLPEPVKATRAQLERDDPALRREQVTSATDAGKPIRDVYDAQNTAITKNLDILKGRVSGRGKTAATAESPEQVGQSVQDAALRKKLETKKAEVSRLYKEAETTGELQGRASPRAIINTIKASPDKTHFGWVNSWLDEMGVVKKDAKGNTVINKLTLKELEDLRQAAVARAMNGGTEGYYAGKVIGAIDQATEGAGGKAYQAARKARREQALEFEEQGAVAQLVENKSRTDRSVALENTWRKTVLGGSIDDVRKVKRSLMTGGTQETRVAGRKAWRDIRAQTIQHIIDESTKGVALRSTGEANISPAAMQKAVRAIGPDKMREIFGNETTRRVNELLEATREVKTTPPPGHPGSSTVGNALAMLEKSISRVPVIGDVGAGLVGLGAKAAKLGEAGRLRRAADRTPLAEGERMAAKTKVAKTLQSRYGGSQSLAGVRPQRSED